MSQAPPIWHATYEAETLDDLADAYGQWATLYDKDTLEGMGYVGPQIAAAMLHGHLDSRSSRVLDAGCGTGLVGEMLHQLGYENIDAMDYSWDMLEEADKKDVYKRLLRENMNRDLEIADNTYDATICVGTFTYAHVGPHAFDELVRVTRPGGHICFSVRDGAYQEYNYRDKMLDLEADRQWELQELREDGYLLKEDVSAKFCTYKILES